MNPIQKWDIYLVQILSGGKIILSVRLPGDQADWELLINLFDMVAWIAFPMMLWDSTLMLFFWTHHDSYVPSSPFVCLKLPY